MKKCLLILSVLFAVNTPLFAQDISSKGKEFWLGFMDHTNTTQAEMDLYITSDSSTTGTVFIDGQSWSVNFTVTANQVTIVNVPSTTAHVGCSDCIQDKGIRVVSGKPIAVYAHIHRNFRSDATLVLPTEASGKAFRVMGWTQESNSSGSERHRSQFMIVASSNNTKVNITPTDQVVKIPGPNRVANVMYTITLNKGQVYQGQAPGINNDLTGTLIEVIDTGASASCKKVAVFSGNSGTRLGCTGGFTSIDNLYEQLYPVNSWGTDFLMAPYLTRNYDRFRVVAHQNGTSVFVNGAFVRTLNAGQFYQSGQINTATYIKTSKPASVAQFQTIQACGGGIGDPSMTMISPIQQTLKDVVLYSSEFEAITRNYINVVMKTIDTSTFTIDGGKVPFTTFPSAPFYAYSRITVNDGTQRLISGGDGFVASAYGMGNWESYGYAAGANVKNLSAYINLDNNTLKATVVNTVCLGEEAVFKGNANYAVKKWEWFFGNDSVSSLQNPKHIYKDTGTYQVKMRVTKLTFDGCSAIDSADMQITVASNPKVKFGYDNACYGTAIRFYDTIENGSNEPNQLKLWDFGNTNRELGTDNPTHLYDTAGRYPVFLRVRNSFECEVNYYDTIEVYPIPKAKFFASNSCYKDSVIMQDSSIAMPYPVTKWIWNMGEGSIDTVYKARNAFLYDTAGTFNIRLTIATEKGCTAQADTNFLKHPILKVGFTAPDACLKTLVSFTDTSKTGGIAPQSRLWTLGDGTTQTAQTFNHKYPQSQDYLVQLKLVQNADCQDSTSKTVRLFKQVEPNFTVQNLCFKDTARLIGNHTPALEVISSYNWLYNSGLVLGKNWNTQFADSGKKQFKLITITSNSCRDTLDSFIRINPKPIADFKNIDICRNSVVQFINTSNNFTRPYTNIAWQSTTTARSGLNDTFRYNLSNPALTENIRLIVSTSDGCADTMIKDIPIWQSPTMNIAIDDICRGAAVEIENRTTSLSGPISVWNWRFSNGLTSADSIPSGLSFSTAGQIKAVLTATTNRGCIGKDSLNFTIFALPTVNYNVAEACLGIATAFNSISNLNGQALQTALYRFGDGNTSATATANNNYANFGNYDTKLIIVTNEGCSDSATRNIKVHAIPVADFSANPLIGCMPLDVDFTDLSTVANDLISSHEWTNATIPFSTQAAPRFTYNNPGVFEVGLEVTSAFGCQNSISKTGYISVLRKPIANFSFLPKDPTIIEPDVNFTDLSVGAIDWAWNFGDGSTANNQNPKYTYKDTGYYTIRLAITNADNCTNDTSFRLFVEPAFAVTIPTAFTPNGDGLNDVWGPVGVLQGVKGYELSIFNRWGEIIFETKDVNAKWDGTYRGQPVQEGYYGIRMRYTDYFYSKWIVNNSNLLLLR